MTRGVLRRIWLGNLVGLTLIACESGDADTGAEEASAHAHATQDAGADATTDAGDTDTDSTDAASGSASQEHKAAAEPGATLNKAPTEYPEDWDAVFVDAQSPPEDVEHGHETTLLEAGTTYGEQTLALPCDVSWERDVAVSLRDGTTIYLDILSPPDAGEKLPAIVAWSPYGKTLPGRSPTTVPLDWFSGIAKFEGPDAAFWVCEGYAIVNVDVRGAYNSEGKIQVFGSVDAGDGYDVIEWIAAQDWSNGNVGMHGASWLAMAQWNIAATNPPHLKAISPWNGQSDLYRNSLVQGGIPDTAFSAMVGGILVGDNGVESTVERLETHALWDQYWADKRPKVEDIKAAAYVGADIASALHTAGTLDGFRRLGSKDKWLRVNDTNEWYDQYTRDNEKDLLRFFDHYLRGIDNDWQDTPKVRVTVMDPGPDGDRKVNTPYEAWPLPDTEYKKLYLDGETGTLRAEAPETASTVSYDAESGQTTFSIRFEQDTQLVGYPMAKLYVATDDADDMDIFVLVEKLDKDGNPLLPSELAQMYFPMPPPGVPGRVRTSMRKLDKEMSTDYLPVLACDERQPLTAGELVSVDIPLMPTAMRWHAGEQLELTIAGTFVKGSGLPLTTINQGTHVIHTGGEHASYLQVPMVTFTP